MSTREGTCRADGAVWSRCLCVGFLPEARGTRRLRRTGKASAFAAIQEKKRTEVPMQAVAARGKASRNWPRSSGREDSSLRKRTVEKVSGFKFGVGSGGGGQTEETWGDAALHEAEAGTKLAALTVRDQRSSAIAWRISSTERAEENFSRPSKPASTGGCLP